MSERREETRQQQIPCAVVQDLMPLQIDGVASKESAELVHAHLEDCEGCRAAYARMNAEISVRQQEQIPALRDVMRALWRRLSVRAALAAILAGMLLYFVVCMLSMTTTAIPAGDILPDSVELTIGEDGALLRYVTIRDSHSHTGYGYYFEENPERENELTLHICNSVTMLERLTDRAHYALTGEGSAEHEIDLYDLVIGYEAARYPQDAAIAAIVYDQGIYSESRESLVLWQAQEGQMELTLGQLTDGYRNRLLGES